MDYKDLPDPMELDRKVAEILERTERIEEALDQLLDLARTEGLPSPNADPDGPAGGYIVTW